jgi:PrtD family type I secretion system ABC transporter
MSLTWKNHSRCETLLPKKDMNPGSLFKTSSQPNDFDLVIKALKPGLYGVFIFSGIINVLMLTGSFFMMQVYDRVLPSRSIPTLVGLAVLTLGLFAMQAFFESIRGRILARSGSMVEERLGPLVLNAVIQLPLRMRSPSRIGEPMRDLDSVRAFMASSGPTALADIPWLPIYLLLATLLHPALGLFIFIGSVAIGALAVYTELQTRELTREVLGLTTRRSQLADQCTRNAEAVRALGLAGRLSERWVKLSQRGLQANQAAGDKTANIGAASRGLRYALQSMVLALGAYLVINQQATAGTIIASSIIAGRALAPVDQLIGNWRSMATARLAVRRLSLLLQGIPKAEERIKLPAPVSVLDVSKLTILPPGSEEPVLHDLSFQLKAGEGLGIIGPNGSGKSTLARALVGVWAPRRGDVRLDGSSLDQWNPDDLGRHIGYLPQSIELFDGSIKENIGRHDPEVRDEDIIRAAKTAGCHEMILSLPEGYETLVGDAGATLSIGQRQRIALARALFGDPFLIVLDEPNAALDGQGEFALNQAIQSVRQRGGIVIVIAHRANAISALDKLLVLVDGKISALGPKEDVLKAMARPKPTAVPLKSVPMAIEGAA